MPLAAAAGSPGWAQAQHNRWERGKGGRRGGTPSQDPRPPGLTSQQEVAAGGEQQQDALCQGTEEAAEPAAHDKDEAQGQDHHDSSVEGCQERGLRVRAGTRTDPPKSDPGERFGVLSAWRSAFTGQSHLETGGGTGVTRAQDSQTRHCTEVEASRLSPAKGSLRGTQLFCPAKQKGRETWWAGQLPGPHPPCVPLRWVALWARGEVPARTQWADQWPRSPVRFSPGPQSRGSKWVWRVSGLVFCFYNIHTIPTRMPVYSFTPPSTLSPGPCVCSHVALSGQEKVQVMGCLTPAHTCTRAHVWKHTGTRTRTVTHTEMLTR